MPEEAATAEAERVIVTGSYIPTAEEVGPNPVLIINRELIEKSGERTTEELLRNLTVANANGLPASVPGSSEPLSTAVFDFVSTWSTQFGWGAIPEIEARSAQMRVFVLGLVITIALRFAPRGLIPEVVKRER